jgi:hypothetical protein
MDLRRHGLLVVLVISNTWLAGCATVGEQSV